MRKILVNLVIFLVSLSVILPTAVIGFQQSKQPLPALNTPEIEGPTQCVIGRQYEYSITYIDPEGDDIYFRIYWGDCMAIYKTGPYISGEKVSFSHRWCEKCCLPGWVAMLVLAFDDNGDESEWASYHIDLQSDNMFTTYNIVINYYIQTLILFIEKFFYT